MQVQRSNRVASLQLLKGILADIEVVRFIPPRWPMIDAEPNQQREQVKQKEEQQRRGYRPWQIADHQTERPGARGCQWALRRRDFRILAN